MKLPVAPFQRIAVGVAFCSLAAMGAGAIALATQPASSSALTQHVEYVDPAADEAIVTPAAPVESKIEADRAEVAATRAETAAGRAEVAAVHVDQVVATTTTVTVPSKTMTTTDGPTTSTTSKPTLIGTILPAETSTTTVAKRWVEVARIPAKLDGVRGTTPAPVELALTLETGRLRVTTGRLVSMSSPANGVYGTLAAWVGDSDAPGVDACQPASPEGCASWEVPTGEQTIKVARQWSPLSADQTGAGWYTPYGTTTDIIIEEYR